MTSTLKIIFDSLTHKQYSDLVEYLTFEDKEDPLGPLNEKPYIKHGKITSSNPPEYEDVNVNIKLLHASSRNNSIGYVQGLMKKVLEEGR